MRCSLNIIILFLGFFQTVQAKDISNLRKSFHQSVLQSDKLPVFLDEIERIKNPSALEKAYIGASEALKARESWNPIEKLVYIQKFRAYLTDAIHSDADDIEIRFLRFSIEYNIPSIIRSHKSISEDKSVILKKIAMLNTFEIDKSFINYILLFFEESKLCSAEEINMIKEKLS